MLSKLIFLLENMNRILSTLSYVSFLWPSKFKKRWELTRIKFTYFKRSFRIRPCFLSYMNIFVLNAYKYNLVAWIDFHFYYVRKDKLFHGLLNHINFIFLGITRLPVLEGEVSHVEIPRTNSSLGITIVGGADTPLVSYCIYI